MAGATNNSGSFMVGVSRVVFADSLEYTPLHPET